MRRFFLAAVTIALMLLLSGCSTKEEKTNKWDVFVDNFISEYLEQNPTTAVHAGLHEYDGQFPDWSPDGISKQIKWFYDKRKAAEQFPGNELTGTQKFEREYLYSIIDNKLFWLEDAKIPFKNPMFYLDKINPSVYLTREYAPLKERMKSYIKYANNFPAAVKYIKQNLQLPLPKTFAVLGRNSFKGYVEFFSKDLPEIFESVNDDNLQKELAAANQKAIDAAIEMRDWFESILTESNGSYALGPELFKKMLWATERVDVPLDELKKIAEQDLNRNLKALKEACEKFAPGKSIEECIAIMTSHKPEKGAVESASEQLKMLKKFLIDKSIVSIPYKDEALVDEAPPYNRWNFAYIETPGIYEKNLPAVYYIAPPDPTWSKEMQQQYIPGNADLMFTSVHEVWPGHFLHSLHKRNSPFKVSGVFWGYAFGEGWAHYTEEMMYDLGLGNYDPEYQIGELVNALLRNIRFLSAIGLHTEGMTVEGSKRMFIEKGYIDPGNAMQQAARGTYDPAYLNYTMGKLMIKKLRRDWLTANPDKKLKDFHDKFLSYGSPPIPLVRKDMVGDGGSLF